MSLFEEAIDEEDFFEPDAPVAAASLPLARDNQFLFGCEKQIEFLSRLYAEKKMPHGIILAGQASIGKATFAWHLARAIFADCESGADDGGLFGPAPAKEDCGLNFNLPPDHEVFRKISMGSYPDFRFIEREFDEEKGRTKPTLAIDQIRKIPTFLRNKANHENGWRIVIIDEADMMTEEAQNALLKTLEEPPSNTLIMLVASRAGSLMPTIRSRCRVLNFEPLPTPQIEKIFSSYGVMLPSAHKETLLLFANGSVAPISYLMENGNIEFLQKIWMLMGKKNTPDWVLIHQFAETISRSESEDQYALFENIIKFTFQTLLFALARGQAIPKPIHEAGLAVLVNGHDHLTFLAKLEAIQTLIADIRHSALDRRAGILQIFQKIYE